MEENAKEVEVGKNVEIDDNIATAEEMAEYARQSAERRANKKDKKVVDSGDTDYNEKESADNAVDPYLEPDPNIPWVEYKDNPYLSRGCTHCPESYDPVSVSEMASCSKVSTVNWMKGVRQPGVNAFDVVEVRFKNNRKDYFRLPDGLEVQEGDLVAVEGQPGHDVGLVSLTGEVCRLQMRNRKIDPQSENIKKLFRRAKPQDIERWKETLRQEHDALIRTRQIAAELGLDMKVNDVEFQGDRSKAIFYYTADERVDFRQLIKVLADEFHSRVEMKQIGVRQEAGKVGGIGTCGRELCCSTWLTNFKSVTTGAAKAQQILPNPQKLAGQCGKLKCCLNFEYEVYVDAMKKFPPSNVAIRFKKGLALYKKTDVFRGIMWYGYEGENDLYAIPAESVKQIIEMNQNQEYPERLEDYQVELMSTAALQQEASNAEFEQELRRLAEGGNGVVEEEKKQGGNRREGERQHRDRRDGERGNRENRGSHDRREGRDNHEHRDHRENRDNRERREQRETQEPRAHQERGNQREHHHEGQSSRRHDRNDHRRNRQNPRQDEKN